MHACNISRFVLFCILAIAFAATVEAVPVEHASYFTTQTLTFRTDRNSRISKVLQTTSASDYLRGIQNRLPEPNKTVVNLILEYPVDGTHRYWWPKAGESSYDGSTTNVLLNGRVFMTGEPEGRTFCCGLTLEVFYRMLGKLPAVNFADVDPDEFKRYWFCRDINSPGPEDALTSFGLGQQVEHQDALPGDFVQLWRNDRSGHSVIFVNWLYDSTGVCTGLQYWSTQTSTQGIGYASELFGDQPKQINVKHLSVARPSVNN